MPKMQTSFSGLVALLARNLYTSADVFIRELLQNANDGCQRLLAVDPQRPVRIDLTTSAPERTITFSDNGIGMDEADIHEYLSTIGRSGTAIESARLSSEGLTAETIGQFGVGLLSAFVVAERIDVFTRKLGTATGYHWVSHGGDEYQVAPSTDAPDCGTEISLTLKREYEHFLREEDLVRAVRLFADFLSVPIHVNGEGPVNLRTAPWQRDQWGSPEEQREALERFLSQRYSDRPLLVIPVHIGHPETRGVLYTTDQPMPGVGSSGMVDLYVRRMCIRLNDPDLLPDWATFVRGVIDADLQPTAARDNVQRDAAYHRLRRALGETIVQALLDLRARDVEYFHRLCNWHQVGIKGMALRDDVFFAAVSLHLPFHTNEGTLSLAEYLKRQTLLPSGRKPIYYFPNDADETRFFQICSANGLLAINAGRFFDEAVLEKYADLHPAEVELRRLDHLNTRQLYAEPDAVTVDSFAGVMAALNKVLAARDLQNVVPVLRQFAPDSLAGVLLDEPGGESLERFQALLKTPFVSGSIQDLATEVAARIRRKPMQLLLNASNPLVRSLRDHSDLEGAPAQAILLGLYHLALLNSQRRLKSENARLIDTYLQARLGDILRLQSGSESLARQLAAWRKCTAEATVATADDWAAVMHDLVGATPAEFRERVARANDAELGDLLLQLYQQMKRA
jgi:molecular chaperone HtpG